ncbi:MAG: 3'(2'),5'-bisphosphate nucleotidase CysQ [Gammaproteobacteria bacterium]|nr:3'(2'),5'-bisphosphate nucleotidase CysQ [Gammaproteobacteria bacterium]
MTKLDDSVFKDELIRIVRVAHDEILAVYDTAFDIDRKDDDSPITEADRRAHDVIVSGLSTLDPTIPIVSEESDLPSFEIRSTWSRYWLVDPLDGTKEFVKRNGEFTVNIALIEHHEPTLGVVGKPTERAIYYGNSQRHLAQKITGSTNQLNISTRHVNTQQIKSVQSHRRADPTAERFFIYLEEEFGPIERVYRGSSLKFLALAEGQADFYLQPGGTSEWDTAAAHAVLKAAGGEVLSLRGEPLRYNLRESVLNTPFIAIADVKTTTWTQRLRHHLAIFNG